MLFSGDEGTEIVIYGEAQQQAQQWYVIPMQQDTKGNDLCYKILSFTAPDMALTYFGESDIRLSRDTGSNAQKWLLNAAGLQATARRRTAVRQRHRPSAVCWAERSRSGPLTS